MEKDVQRLRVEDVIQYLALFGRNVIRNWLNFLCILETSGSSLVLTLHIRYSLTPECHIA
jgi:hypothetical protein